LSTAFVNEIVALRFRHHHQFNVSGLIADSRAIRALHERREFSLQSRRKHVGRNLKGKLLKFVHLDQAVRDALRRSVRGLSNVIDRRRVIFRFLLAGMIAGGERNGGEHHQQKRRPTHSGSSFAKGAQNSAAEFTKISHLRNHRPCNTP
jgi:hypothetical protein